MVEGTSPEQVILRCRRKLAKHESVSEPVSEPERKSASSINSSMVSALHSCLSFFPELLGGELSSVRVSQINLLVPQLLLVKSDHSKRNQTRAAHVPSIFVHCLDMRVTHIKPLRPAMCECTLTLCLLESTSVDAVKRGAFPRHTFSFLQESGGIIWQEEYV
jgi:hypothetical protein